MGTLIKIALVIIISFLPLKNNAQDTFKLTVSVEGVDNNEGQILIALYDKESDFLENTYKGTVSKIKDNACQVTFENIPKGIYAVSLFHDENSNNKLDSNFIGIPKEDYACSNNAKGFMGPPKWKDAKFELKSDVSITITL